MISDEVFKNALDVAYKEQGLSKHKRNMMIFLDMQMPLNHRNEYLDKMEDLARKHQAAKKAAKKIPSEAQEQKDFVLWFKKTYPDVRIMCIWNGGSRTNSEKTEQMLMGLLPGAADLYIPAWHLWIEFKRVKGGVVSKEQEKFADYVRNECGDWYFIAEGFENGKDKTLDFFQFIRNKT